VVDVTHGTEPPLFLASETEKERGTKGVRLPNKNLKGGTDMSNEIALEDYKRACREMRIEEEKRGFLIHLIVYVLVNAGLITLNLLVVPEFIWFYWPLLGWGIGVTANYLGAVRWIEKDLKKKEAIAESRARELSK
jgi:hypothetical protein